MATACDIFEGLLPTAYVEKITLDGGGGVLLQSNPHIDHESEPEFALSDKFGNNLLVKPEIPTVLKTPESAQGLTCTIDLVIKDTLMEGVPSWYTNQDFTKYLKLKIIKSTHPDIDESLKGNINYEPPTSLNIHHEVQESSIQAMLNDLENQGYEASKDLYSTTNANGDTVYSFPFNFKFLTPKLEPTHLSFFVYAYIQIEGPGGLQEELNLTIPNTIKNLNGYVVFEPIVRNGNVVKQRTDYYLPSSEIWEGPRTEYQGSYYTGQGVVIDPTGRPVSDQTTEILTPVNMPNNKIQDFRIIPKLLKMTMDTGGLETRLQNLGFDFEKTRLKKVPLFSDFWLARDEKNQCRFMFGFEQNKALVELSEYSELLKRAIEKNADKGQTLIDSALAYGGITSISVFRRRVEPTPTNNRLGVPYVAEKPFDENTSEITIISLNDTFVKLGRRSAIGSLKLENISYPDQDENPNAILHYSGMDRQVGGLSDGHYQYGVEIQLKDGLYFLLKSFHRRLLLGNTRLKRYYEKASVPAFKVGANGNSAVTEHGAYDSRLNRFTEKFASNQLSQPVTEQAWIQAIALYIDTLDSLQIFNDQTVGIGIDEVGDALREISSPDSGTPEGILIVVKLIDDLINQLALLLNIDIKNNQTRDTILKNGKAYNPSRLESGRPEYRDRTIRIKHYFDNSFDRNVLNATGIDYLNVRQASNDLGLRTVDGGDYESELKKEATDFGIGSQTERANWISTFSPAQIAIEGETSVLRENPGNRGNANITDNIQATVTYYNNHGNIQGNAAAGYARQTATDTNASNVAADILQTKNLVIETLNELPANNEACLGTKKITKKQKTPASEYLSSTSNFLSEGLISDDNDNAYSVRDQLASIGAGISIVDGSNVTRRASVAGSGANTAEAPSLLRTLSRTFSRDVTANTRRKPTRRVNRRTGNVTADASQAANNSSERATLFSPGNQGALNSLRNKFFNSPYDATAAAEEFNELPVQARHALEEGMNGARYLQEDGAFVINYGLLASVEVFNGYGLNNPNWIPLDYDIYRTLSGEPEQIKVLCRLKEYNNDDLGMGEQSGMKLPIFHQYFLLSPVKSDELIVGEEAVREERLSILQQAINYTNAGHASISGVSMTEAGHQHQFILNEDGSGLLYEACNPDHPTVCHTHMIENFQIQSGHSTNIDPEHGTAHHIHKFPSDIVRLIRNLIPNATVQETREIVREATSGTRPTSERRAKRLAARGAMGSRLRRNSVVRAAAGRAQRRAGRRAATMGPTATTTTRPGGTRRVRGGSTPTTRGTGRRHRGGQRRGTAAGRGRGGGY